MHHECTIGIRIYKNMNLKVILSSLKTGSWFCKTAEVVHSICNSYGGTANKNVGDAFLVSWSLDVHFRVENSRSFGGSFSKLYNADGNMFHRHGSPTYADSAFWGNDQLVARIFMEILSETAQKRLGDKLTKRKGPIVQMGFGPYAGKAVQGAIESQRKIHGTYVSEAVEFSECSIFDK